MLSMLWYCINTLEVHSHQSLIKLGGCGLMKLKYIFKLDQENKPAAVLQWFMLATTDMPVSLCHACLKRLNFSWLGFKEFEKIPVWYILGKQNSAFKSRQSRPMRGKGRERKFLFVCFDQLLSVCAEGTFIYPLFFLCSFDY